MTVGPVLILGATSAIARAAAVAFAAKDYPLYLAGRDRDELARLADDLNIRYGIDVRWGLFDAEDFTGHAAFVNGVQAETGALYGVLLAFGYLGEQQLAAHDARERELIIVRNLTGAISILEYCADVLERQRAGFIIAISSVAGDRGRQSNYLYGAAKGGLNIYLQGLRNRLFHAGVRVVTVKPGFVDTAMTFGRPGMFLLARPEQVGQRIVAALERRADVIYVPWFWRYIMLAIRLLPETLFKRLKL
jgi:decaprenylphospho-beta-D-erythro-pentofuranosid-2-ulose 2-reductase